MLRNSALSIVHSQRQSQDLIKQTSKQFGDTRVVVVASHAHTMYRPIPGDMIDFESLRVEGLSSLRTMTDVQASLQRYVLVVLRVQIAHG
jgi:hypothetical protein